ncbi:MAG: gamma-glutamyl-gamma-aminobutyrate hydrolase family protein [Rhodospirillales bacterium]|nr:gamma-glutamyl-gamma-aminobutyrate hydrolase family protein [Rhodospirillales bacterium]MDE2200696.1 gamma-glutamyl-gamma-aminobutyrate hydrolase family protein [Rhodospirillales bacterium]MDE2576721.1 gamma-glutamyl-gamma-aminobutyrate hydrolase family protein [Rhodospirillales bacterium]
MSLIVGIPACSKQINELSQHATPARYGAALMAASGALPVLLPPVGEGMLEVLDRLDGLLLDGSPSNIEPARYGVATDETPGQHDPERDDTTLALARAALARGMPVLAICRGIQELNVALGGTLHQRVHELPGRLDHRSGGGTPDHMFRLKHMVTLSGRLARLVGATEIMVNSLHGQAIDRPAEGLVVEAVAPDGTIEAVRVANAPGWAFGVQFHPEWHVQTDAPSRAIFEAYGAACAAYSAGLRRAA